MSWGLDLDESAVLAALWEHAQIGLAVVGPDGKWVSANRTMCAFLEYTEAELRKLTWQDLTHPGDLDADAERAADVARSRIGGYDMHKRYCTKSGRVVWASLRVVPLVATDGRFVAYLSQVSQVVPVTAPVEERRVRHGWRWIRDYWAPAAVVLASLGVIAGRAIEWISGK